MKRIVLDTNVTISALFWRGHPRVIYDLVREGKLTLPTGIKIERAFIKVLAYSRFGLTPTEVLPIVNSLRKYVHFIEIKSKVDAVKEDPTDNIFLECLWMGMLIILFLVTIICLI
jgi:putative PIN family toxin of toxin-antitoxin system